MLFYLNKCDNEAAPKFEDGSTKLNPLLLIKPLHFKYKTPSTQMLS